MLDYENIIFSLSDLYRTTDKKTLCSPLQKQAFLHKSHKSVEWTRMTHTVVIFDLMQADNAIIHNEPL